MNAHNLIKLLRNRFEKDHFFTSEIQCGKHRQRFDALAIKASWSHPAIHGFEIKVSRADFLKDDKWPGYLDHCKQFWFVTAPGVIVDKSEIPESAGWIEATKNGVKIMTRKKAPAREIDPKQEANLFRQIIHRRHYKAHLDRSQSKEERIAHWEGWLAEREAGKRVGNAVTTEIRNNTVNVARENERLKRKITEFEVIKTELEKRGFRIQGHHVAGCEERYARRIVEAAFPEANGRLPEGLDTVVRLLRSAEKETSRVAMRLEEAAKKMATESHHEPVEK